MRLGFGCLTMSSAPASRPLDSTSTNHTIFRRPYILSNRKTLSMRVYVCVLLLTYFTLSFTWTRYEARQDSIDLTAEILYFRVGHLNRIV
jgi:hypothetical protein